jgi:hypothetical protein
MANFGGFWNAPRSSRPRDQALGSESPPRAISRGPLASRGTPRCILHIPDQGRPWCMIVSEITASPRQFMIVSADAPDNMRHSATALVGRALRQQGGPKSFPRAARSPGLQQGHPQSTIPHSGACIHHAVPRILVGNAFRQGFYWPTAVCFILQARFRPSKHIW